MHRAQAEVDAVVGRDRLPTLDDLDTLPYTHALVHELLRLWPIAPLSKIFIWLNSCENIDIRIGIPRSNMEV